MKEALFYEKLEGAAVRCGLCRHGCRIAEGNKGLCCVRENRAGVLYSLNYDAVIAEHIDPIEKKPLFHFLPGSRSYSIAAPGCNFTCRHCQNAEISQLPRERGFCSGRQRNPEDIVTAALPARCESISYTYTEPTIYFELACETARIAASKGLKNIFVTNGYIAAEPLKKIRPCLHAANIDLKAYSDDFYRTVCGARLEPVLDSIRLHRELGIWIEVTTLIIPGLNDSPDMLAATAGFLAGLGRDIPWHVTAFYPTYKLTDRARTPLETLLLARDIGRQTGLEYVYAGNIPGSGAEDTLCAGCGSLLIERRGFAASVVNLRQGRCGSCGTACSGIFE